ncbi:Gfo/Idh/MocA family protein [Microlunatus soli]|uniref:Myo-inositol 2-dehydrogenase / D-chiro-inositol 1-dehydrogenase n=1 Tax=Microlunatus soli TaxID=630515 RepID=A0A1H1W0W5_9ACTN|nr:Gfo/Idh/MocA family oxidoreductase [Microlunatus soli]SDS90747.1 myo-inositol 2-dehydrogenase / D-chiro-inositol 1-dehydrogenase [Microlunatus soli]
MRIGLVGTGRIGAFHASTLAGLDQVDEVVLTDAVPGAAETLAAEHGYGTAPDVDTLLGQVDGVVITTPTTTHAALLRQTVAAGLPTFCEKPVAMTLDESIELVDLVESSTVPVQIGFQRRFDTGYRRARDAVRSGDLGFVHTLRANTHDQAPPPAAYIPTSGGLFRDCSIHDFDIIRFVTGREVLSVYGVGANKGDDFFTEGGDVDTCAAVLTLDDDTVVTVSATRYNGAGHDVRLEVMGSAGTVGVGFDDSLAVRSAEDGVDYPRGPQKWSFMERFQPAYRRELGVFADLVAGRVSSPCTVRDGLQAFRIAEACELSRRRRARVDLAEIPDDSGTTGAGARSA